jgi:hypothetical protein
MEGGGMSPYLGGSAPAMAHQVADGYTLVTSVQLKRLTEVELGLLQFELDRLLREARSSVVPLDDQAAVQARNRRITRLSGTVRQIQASLSQRRRGA